jgi:hypothetical protein
MNSFGALAGNFTTVDDIVMILRAYFMAYLPLEEEFNIYHQIFSYNSNRVFDKKDDTSYPFIMVQSVSIETLARGKNHIVENDVLQENTFCTFIESIQITIASKDRQEAVWYSNICDIALHSSIASRCMMGLENDIEKSKVIPTPTDIKRKTFVNISQRLNCIDASIGDFTEQTTRFILSYKVQSGYEFKTPQQAITNFDDLLDSIKSGDMLYNDIS